MERDLRDVGTVALVTEYMMSVKVSVGSLSFRLDIVEGERLKVVRARER